MKEYIEVIIEKVEINSADIICGSGTGTDTPLPWIDEDIDSFYMDHYYNK